MRVNFIVEDGGEEKEKSRPLMALLNNCPALLSPGLFTLFLSIEFVKILLLFCILGFWPQGVWDLSSPTRG